MRFARTRLFRAGLVALLLSFVPQSLFAGGGVPVEGEVGERLVGPGSSNAIRQDNTAASVTTNGHGRYTELNARSRLFRGGMTTTSISNVTFTTGTLGATETPIVGIWNPLASNMMVYILSATMIVNVTAATATGPGGFVWAMSRGNDSISTGNLPLNMKTLTPGGTLAKDMSGVALTGLTNNMVVRFGSALFGGLIKNASSVETAVGQNIGLGGNPIEYVEGGIAVPPGGVVALLSTTTTVAHSATTSIMWEEIPILN